MLSSELDAWRQNRKIRFEEEQEPALEAPTEAENRQTTVPRKRRWLALSFAAAVLAALLTLVYVAARSRAGDASRPKIESLAVLPLQNLSGDSSQDYVADGMTEELIGRLSRIHGLRVISRTSTMHFKNTQLSVPEIAKMLAVDAIVEGSLVREGNEIRVHAQNKADITHLILALVPSATPVARSQRSTSTVLTCSNGRLPQRGTIQFFA